MAKVGVSSRFSDKQQGFLDFVLSHYVDVGVRVLDLDKLKDLLNLKYGSISDAQKALGPAPEIGKFFAGFQQYLYISAA